MGANTTGSIITQLDFYCQKVLPAVYDDSLSYYEVLNKVAQKLNELIELYGDTATIEALKEAVRLIEEKITDLREHVDTEDAEIRSELAAGLAKEAKRADKYSDEKNEELRNYLLEVIYKVKTGNILVESQTDGQELQPLQEELDRSYDYLRPFGVAAQDFDSMTYDGASELDELGLTGKELDIAGAVKYYAFYS